MPDPSDPALDAKRRASLARIQRIAYWLDDAFTIPVIDQRVGVDGLVGLIPVAGDLVGAGLSSLLFLEARRLRAPRSIWLRMAGNIGLDFGMGLVPIVGDIADVAWKANRRNAAIVQRWLEQVTPADP